MAYEINATAPEEAALFYSNAEKDRELGCIGHLRGDFGRSGKEFWTTWWEHQSGLKTQEFKDEFDMLINSLREHGFMKDRGSMADYCYSHAEARIPGAWHHDVFGFRLDTANIVIISAAFLTPAIITSMFTVTCMGMSVSMKGAGTGNRNPLQ